MSKAALYSMILHTGVMGGLCYFSHKGVLSPRLRHDTPIACVSLVWESPEEGVLGPVTPCVEDTQVAQEPEKMLQRTEKPIKKRAQKKSFAEQLISSSEASSDSKETNFSEKHSTFAAHPHNRLPAYPEKARDFALEGRCLFRLTLSPNGRVKSCECLTQNFPLILKDEAEKVLKTWTFLGQCPPTIDVPIQFVLDEE